MTQYFESTDLIRPMQNYSPKVIKAITRFASARPNQTNSTQALALMAGIITETAQLFEQPEESSAHMLQTISEHINAAPCDTALDMQAFMPSHLVDQNAEKGKAIAQDILADWELCVYEFQKLITNCVQQILNNWAETHMPKKDSLRLLSEMTYRALAYEIAAQELCDMIIETKTKTRIWDLNTCISALCAVSGHKHARNWHNLPLTEQLSAPYEDLDNIIHCMTQEAVRHGVPAGSNWRFGLAANDIPITAPHHLVEELEPYCDDFFSAIQMHHSQDQAIACAKASGRLLAIVSGGEIPEIEPAIVKPLAVAAMSDTYKSVYSENFYRA